MQIFCHIYLQYSFSGTGKNVFPKKAKKNIQAKKTKRQSFFRKKTDESKKNFRFSDKNAKNGEETQKMQPSCQGAQPQVTIILPFKGRNFGKNGQKSQKCPLLRSKFKVLLMVRFTFILKWTVYQIIFTACSGKTKE
ncbi:hypothetical protein [uncultured Fibrobacter sp.]|uniref:hypothetical protein n=1 Tax=uncultured Fibrobacter sp. TaxID=261512 RepID=UPI002603940E|nr:hypothetical protein [uncultured Fibrobacter sp.]